MSEYVEELKREGARCLILANLSEAERKSFHHHKVPYTGATGDSRELWGPLAPYIATCLSELEKSVQAIGWKNSVLSHEHGQLILRRADASLLAEAQGQVRKLTEEKNRSIETIRYWIEQLTIMSDGMREDLSVLLDGALAGGAIQTQDTGDGRTNDTIHVRYK